jgi:hypothetical protein
MRLRKGSSRDQTVHDAIRGSVPHGKLDKARIVLTDSRGMTGMEGCTLYGKGDVVERLDMPRGEDFYASTVRSHETRHATFSKRWSYKVKEACRASEKMYFCVNIIEDCIVEQTPLPAMRHEALRNYCREHLAAATKDIIDIKRHKRVCDANPEHPMNTPESRNGRILCGTRALAMLQVYGPHCGTSHAFEAEALLAVTVGQSNYEVMQRIVALSRHGGHRMTAMRLLSALLENEERDMPDLPPIPFPLVEGDGKGVGMKIIDLNPKSAWTSHDKKVTILPAPSGSIVRVNRYVQAIVSGDANGLFCRRYRQNPSGTVLIDASGSMHATTENVKRLCAMIPDATIAYYSGDDIRRGVLAIYASKNKRYNGELPTETLLGGNSVDMEALQWLQKQAQPWTLISDLGFCGSSFGGEEVAHAIVDRETAAKRLTVIPTFKKAFDIFSARKAKGKVAALPTVAAIKAREYDDSDDDDDELI